MCSRCLLAAGLVTCRRQLLQLLQLPATLNSDPVAHSFIIGPAVINTHTLSLILTNLHTRNNNNNNSHSFTQCGIRGLPSKGEVINNNNTDGTLLLILIPLGAILHSVARRVAHAQYTAATTAKQFDFSSLSLYTLSTLRMCVAAALVLHVNGLTLRQHSSTPFWQPVQIPTASSWRMTHAKPSPRESGASTSRTYTACIFKSCSSS